MVFFKRICRKLLTQLGNGFSAICSSLWWTFIGLETLWKKSQYKSKAMQITIRELRMFLLMGCGNARITR